MVTPAPDLLVESQVRCTAQTALLRVLVKNSANKKRIVTDISAQKERFFRCCAGEGDQHVGNILSRILLAALVGGLQKRDSRKLFQERPDIIAQFAIGDPGIAQDMSGENVEIELRRNPQLTGLR